METIQDGSNTLSSHIEKVNNKYVVKRIRCDVGYSQTIFQSIIWLQIKLHMFNFYTETGLCFLTIQFISSKTSILHKSPSLELKAVIFLWKTDFS